MLSLNIAIYPTRKIIKVPHKTTHLTHKINPALVGVHRQTILHRETLVLRGGGLKNKAKNHWIAFREGVDKQAYTPIVFSNPFGASTVNSFSL